MLASGGNETENKIELTVAQLLPPQRSSQQAAFVFPNITRLSSQHQWDGHTRLMQTRTTGLIHLILFPTLSLQM